jgi:hypothetical protein
MTVTSTVIVSSSSLATPPLRSPMMAISRSASGMKRPPIRVDLKVMLYQSQEADNTFITSDGTSLYSSTR